MSPKGNKSQNSIQKITIENKKRIETGALRINDDWKGLFIRGDDAIMLLGLFETISKEETVEWTEIEIAKAYVKIIREEVLS